MNNINNGNRAQEIDELKEKFTNRVEKISETKLNRRYSTKAVSMYAVATLTYSFNIWYNKMVKERAGGCRMENKDQSKMYPNTAIKKQNVPQIWDGRGIIDQINLHNELIYELEKQFLTIRQESQLRKAVVKANN